MARTTSSRLSLLGVLSILIGWAAFAAPYIPQIPVGAMIVALAGIGVGVLALIVSISGGRSNSGIPVIGILISLGAIALDSYNTGGLVASWTRSKSAPPATPAAVTTPQVVIPTYQPRKNESNNIFGIPSGGSDAPSVRSTPAPSVGPIPPVHHDSTPSIKPPTPSIPIAPGPSIQEARSKLDAATAKVELSLASDPAYRQAKADVAAAEARKKAALAASGAGSSEVMETAQQLLDAKSKLAKIIAGAVAKDPAAQTAQREVSDAEKAGRRK